MQLGGRLRRSLGAVARVLREGFFGTVRTWHLWWYVYAPTEAVNFLAGLASWYFFSVYAAGLRAGEVFEYLAVGLLVSPVFMFAVENPYRYTRALYAGWFSSYGYRLKLRDYYRMAGVSLLEYMASRFIESFLFLAVRFAAYAAVLGAVFGIWIPLDARLLDLAAVLALGFLAMLPIGFLLAATYALYYNMPQVVVNPFVWGFSILASIVCGVYFPPGLLPGPLRALSAVIPETYAVEAVRAVLLGGAGLPGVWDRVAVLAAAALLNLPAVAVYRWAVSWIDRRV